MLDKEYKDTWNTRVDNLEELEVASYQEFLLSPLWKELKNKASKRENFQSCYVCGCSDKLELHHLSYKFLTELRNVRSVCRVHHQEIHDLAKEKGISVRLATRQRREAYARDVV